MTTTLMAQEALNLHEVELKRNPGNIRARIQVARHHFEKEHFDKVVDLLNPYTDQLDSGGFLMLSMSYTQQKDHANSVRILKIVSEKEESNHKWLMLLAQSYLMQAAQSPGTPRSAELLTLGIQSLRKTLRMAPHYKPAFDLLLSTLLKQKANNEARELLSEGIDKFGKRPDLFKELCRLDAVDGYLVQAVEHCRESIKISPNFPDHYVYLIQALRDQKEDQIAEKHAVSAAKKFPKSEFVQWGTGTLFFKKQNYPVATRYFQAAVDSKPDSGRAHFGLAQSLFEQGNPEKALAHFIKACKSDPETVDTFHAYSGRMKQTKNSAMAAKYAQAANSCRF